MATYFKLFDSGRQFFTDAGVPLAGGKLDTDATGTSTPKTTFQDELGAVSHANPIILDAGGRIPADVWGTTGAYKITVTDSANAAIDVYPYVEGINDVAESTASEWIASTQTATFASTTSFTYASDQSAIFTAGRRVKMVDSGGIVYATISASDYNVTTPSITTITLTVDAGGVIDSGLSAVSYGLISSVDSSINLTPIQTVYLNAASPAAWTHRVGLRHVVVEILAGGGGGGGMASNAGFAGAGAGGGGGSYSRKLILASDLAAVGATETITIGAGGTAGASGENTGGTGGTSSFGSHCSAVGGFGGSGGGTASASNGGVGGAATGGDINFNGTDGGSTSGALGSTSALFHAGGSGGSYFGGGNRSIGSSGGSTGPAGQTLGAGGSPGTCAKNDASNYAGGAGAAGIAIVTEFY